MVVDHLDIVNLEQGFGRLGVGHEPTLEFVCDIEKGVAGHPSDGAATAQ